MSNEKDINNLEDSSLDEVSGGKTNEQLKKMIINRKPNPIALAYGILPKISKEMREQVYKIQIEQKE